jgi:hypothetical protein
VVLRLGSVSDGVIVQTQQVRGVDIEFRMATRKSQLKPERRIGSLFGFVVWTAALVIAPTHSDKP